MLPPQDRLPILESAGQTGALLEELATRAKPADPLPISQSAEMKARGMGRGRCCLRYRGCLCRPS